MVPSWLPKCFQAVGRRKGTWTEGFPTQSSGVGLFDCLANTHLLQNTWLFSQSIITGLVFASEYVVVFSVYYYWTFCLLQNTWLFSQSIITGLVFCFRIRGCFLSLLLLDLFFASEYVVVFSVYYYWTCFLLQNTSLFSQSIITGLVFGFFQGA